MWCVLVADDDDDDDDAGDGDDDAGDDDDDGYGRQWTKRRTAWLLFTYLIMKSYLAAQTANSADMTYAVDFYILTSSAVCLSSCISLNIWLSLSVIILATTHSLLARVKVYLLISSTVAELMFSGKIRSALDLWNLTWLISIVMYVM